MKKIILLFAYASTFAQVVQPVPNGSITGTLVGDDGTAIAGATVSLHLLTATTSMERQVTEWLATSDMGGLFRISSLYAGSYRFCVQAPDPWLNPCEWGLQPPTIVLATNQDVQSITITVKKGAAVPIRVDDPGQLLPKNEGITPGAHLLVGVGSDTFVFLPAAVVSSDSAGRVYQVVIPFGVTTNLVIHSAFFELSDAAGLPVARTGTAMMPLAVASGQQPPAVRLTVTGTAQ